MNCTIWRSTSTSAPFSASSANAIVEVVIVFSRIGWWVAPQPYPGTYGGHPLQRRSTLTDLHHVLGHHPQTGARGRAHLRIWQGHGTSAMCSAACAARPGSVACWEG